MEQGRNPSGWLNSSPSLRDMLEGHGMLPNQVGPATPRSPFDNGGGPALMGQATTPDMGRPDACFGSLTGNFDSSSIPSTATNVDLGSLPVQIKTALIPYCALLEAWCEDLHAFDCYAAAGQRASLHATTLHSALQRCKRVRQPVTMPTRVPACVCRSRR